MHELSRSKIMMPLESPHDLLLVDNSKRMPISCIFQYIVTQNMQNLEFDLSRSLRAEGNDVQI